MTTTPNTPSASDAGSVELEALRSTLDGLRNTILDIVTGLSDTQLHTAALPSGWTPLELLKHLTLGDERYWFSSIIGGGDLDWVPQGPRADWMLDPDDPPRGKDPLWNEWGIDFPTVRVIMHHMLVETATHVGHLDAAAELLDGRQRLVMD